MRLPQQPALPPSIFLQSFAWLNCLRLTSILSRFRAISISNMWKQKKLSPKITLIQSSLYGRTRVHFRHIFPPLTDLCISYNLYARFWLTSQKFFYHDTTFLAGKLHEEEKVSGANWFLKLFMQILKHQRQHAW